jgi:hypothetical protein
MTRVVSYGLSPWRPRSDPGLVHVRHVVDKVVLGQVSLSQYFHYHISSFLQCSILIIILIKLKRGQAFEASSLQTK